MCYNDKYYPGCRNENGVKESSEWIFLSNKLFFGEFWYRYLPGEWSERECSFRERGKFVCPPVITCRGREILISEETINFAGKQKEDMEIRVLDIKGISEPVPVYVFKH